MKAAFALLVLTIACRQSADVSDPTSGPLRSDSVSEVELPPAVSVPAVETKPDTSFPTFEPFTGFIGIDEVGSVAELEASANESLKQFETMDSEVLDFWLASRPCSLPSEMTIAQRVAAWYVPPAVKLLAPLWRSDPWTADQVEEARAAARILLAFPDAPRPRFAVGDQEQNQADLAEIASWFHRSSMTPEGYAAMLGRHAIDSGPYVGLPTDPADPLSSRGACQIDDKSEFRLYHIERETNPWVFQVVRDGVPLWTRVVCPSQWFNKLRFLDYSPETVANLGTYGWRVTLGWDGEDCDIYLDEEGRLLFFFVGFN